MGADLNLDITSANQNNSQIENLKSILLQFVEIIHHGKHDNDNKQHNKTVGKLCDISFRLSG